MGLELLPLYQIEVEQFEIAVEAGWNARDGVVVEAQFFQLRGLPKGVGQLAELVVLQMKVAQGAALSEAAGQLGQGIVLEAQLFQMWDATQIIGQLGQLVVAGKEKLDGSMGIPLLGQLL